ncbi:MAG TPA: dihydrodipicolinate reductase C-terminal domain-containing protein [Ignavibacteriales bacterium]|nr:dihydrodipicolinate reductase C-terminal domain-containing protein [Ignavibacteriales bacterium]HOL81036.1 dihydrodipicolinate reductase C-terminal domain-containing protein [Ignavibacteriales bacterium]HOM64771.1 dihydrodipicolinate reductase C-terminal domain-containing protein [Ignavibacteriales bacterium]HPD68487.1 dihydrodipicolinate reductase C-terminal domain-containing protein [Ignavibacteriales bacterium]HPP32816.1 dihydrodipicolinate reductase C-terminal domain-containing protein [
MKYGIIGYSGRMGQEIYKVFSEAEHQLVFTFDENGENFIEKPELLIDFSLAEVFPKTVEYAKKFSVPLIIGTTGLTKENLLQLEGLSKDIPVFQSYNFSLGIQLLLKCVDLVKNYTHDWDVEIDETHHRFKKDKPSGTAIMIKEKLDREVEIHSLRLGNVVGEHTISFGSLGEVLKISHTALSRRTFAEGVLTAAKFLIQQKPGYYNFSKLIK